jgi:hypothetical protein
MPPRNPESRTVMALDFANEAEKPAGIAGLGCPDSIADGMAS